MYLFRYFFYKLFRKFYFVFGKSGKNLTKFNKFFVSVIKIYKKKFVCVIDDFKINYNIDSDNTVKHLINMGYEAMVVKHSNLVEYENHDNNFHNYIFLPI